MKIKTGHINGERVYVVESPSHLPRKDRRGKRAECFDVQVFKHRDLIHMLNKIFRRMANADSRELAETWGVTSPLWGLLNTLKDGEWALPFEIKDQESVVFDDQGKIPLAKEPRLSSGKRPSAYSNPQDVPVGLETEAAPEQSGVPTDPESGQQKRSQDTFVNLDMLYEQLADPLRQLDIDLSWAKGWLGPTYIEDSLWIPA